MLQWLLSFGNKFLHIKPIKITFKNQPYQNAKPVTMAFSDASVVFPELDVLISGFSKKVNKRLNLYDNESINVRHSVLTTD